MDFIPQYKNRDTLGDVGHEFYHITPENINSGRFIYGGTFRDPRSLPYEWGDFGAYNFEDSVQKGECLCRFYTGEDLLSKPQPQPRRGLLEHLWDIIFK